MAKLTVRDLDVRGKRVFARVDYNVPLEERDGKMVITDATRIVETLPTLKLLIEKGARIVLASHLGRPKGKPDPAMSLRPAGMKLHELLGKPVEFANDCIGDHAEKVVASLKDGDVALLENVRYYKEEEANDPRFAAKLARFADVYVNDAFGSAHRAHASTEGVARIVAGRGGQCAAGLLMERELKFLGEELEKPARPFVVILGGAKVSDKIKVIDRLLEKADTILIGGAMAYTFKLAHGEKTGKSLVEPGHARTALDAEAKARKLGVNFQLPVDVVVATAVDTGKRNKKGKPIFDFTNIRTVNGNIPDDAEGFSIGEETAARYAEIIGSAKTILWNGPLGMFEDARFAGGTNRIAKAVAAATRNNGAKSIIGGGDSVKAVNQAGLGDQVTFMSTGGGASLEFLEGAVLPGVAALTDK
ncbi:MAG: phosphoglycerate kinase [Verrucomicrobia bacterium]|nr:phosphoglycerate kinase [Verrucomicrobiota bacterium]MDE3097954.1 phosphoglycerate kinase [Verrucomicrobiota bacterium]